MMLNCKYGNYSEKNHEFVITTADIPRHWYNYLWNDSYITYVSQAGAGEGFLQDSMGRRINLVSDRCFFLMEEDKHWGISGLPVEETRDDFSCVHGHGYSEIKTEHNMISTKLTFFVPERKKCELWRLKVKNHSDKQRTIKVMGYCGTQIDGGYARQGYNLSVAKHDSQIGGIICSNLCDFEEEKNIPYYAYLALSETPDNYDATVNAFIGPYGSYAYPKAVLRGGLTGTDCCGEKVGFALEKGIMLMPQEEKEITFICGVEFGINDVAANVQYFSSADVVENELERVKEKFRLQIRDVSIETPDEELNKLFSWLKHEANLGSRWARVRHNGYRDITSDCECLAAVNPKLALERFKRILTFQYSNGYAPRAFRLGEICDDRFADNTVWITFTAASIMKELGDKSILDCEVPFNDGSVATIYEHIRRSVDFLYHFRGNHNLIKIWGGDWNDCMNRAGLEGKGVSVWLSLAWYRANSIFAEIAELYGREEDVQLALERKTEMREIIEEHGWDGEYYLCAYNDWDDKIGSKECEEGKMFLIPQLWSVLSGVSDMGREVIAMDAVEKYLSTPMGTVISIPPYSKFNPKVGTITTKPAGVHENGGVYLHTIAWKIAADSILKRAEQVEKDIETILPFRNKVVDGKAEPYVLCNSYFGEQTGYRYGTPGQSWRTATGQWFGKALINYVFGLMPEMDGLTLSPCIPPSWEKCSIDKAFREATYHIAYENGGSEIESIMVNGECIKGNILPYEKDKKYIVNVKMKKS